MPIFMDVHILPGVKAKDVAEAHRLDEAGELGGAGFQMVLPAAGMFEAERT